MSQTTIPVPKLRFSMPSRNLPGRDGVTTAEDRFTIAFARAYLTQAESLHPRSSKKTISVVREIPVNGYGITDLLAIAWAGLPNETFPSVEAFAAVAEPMCRAFEMKLSNWQKGLSQTSRYRYFAHQAILVLPPDVCDNALRFLDTFQKVNIGLWSFNPASCVIVQHLTPRTHRPKSDKYWLQSLEKASRASKSVLPICEKAESRHA